MHARRAYKRATRYVSQETVYAGDCHYLVTGERKIVYHVAAYDADGGCPIAFYGDILTLASARDAIYSHIDMRADLARCDAYLAYDAVDRALLAE